MNDVALFKLTLNILKKKSTQKHMYDNKISQTSAMNTKKNAKCGISLKNSL